MKRHMQDKVLGYPLLQYIFDSKFLINGKQARSEFYVSFERAIEIVGIAPRRRPGAIARPKSTLLLDDGSEHEGDYERAGPTLSISCTGPWLWYALFAYDAVLPAHFHFTGPGVGYLSTNEGYEAASSGSQSRLAKTVDLRAALTVKSLDLEISGTVGPMLEGTYGNQRESDTAEGTFDVAFSIPVEFVPEVLCLSKYDTNFQRRLRALTQT